MIIYEKPFGRLGNNIIQLKHICQLAIGLKEQVKFINDIEFFDLKYIVDYFKNNKDKKDYTNKYNFFYVFIKTKNPLIPKNINYLDLLDNTEEFLDYFITHRFTRTKLLLKNNDEAICILKKAFKIKIPPALPEDTLVIHIRSGDVFNKNPDNCYIPPPLSYYLNIIDCNNYKRIILLAENKANPVIDKLLEIYPHIEYRQNTLEQDIKIVLSASHIVNSVGTFIPALLFLSDNYKKYYCPDYYRDELEDYYKQIGTWRSTRKQKKLMLNFSLEQV